jgi:hypothetical protein
MIQDNLKDRLVVLRGTLRRACAMDGAARFVFVLIMCLIVGITIDYLFFRWDRDVHQGVNAYTLLRSIMLLGIVGGLGVIAWRRIVAPLSVPLSIDDMALSVEKEFPQLNDSLISTVQLTRMMSDDRTISAPMIEEVARNAYQQTAALDFGRVVKFDRIRPMLFSAGGSLALFAILFATPLQAFLSVGLMRLINPFSKSAYPVRTFITVLLDEGKTREKVIPRSESTKIIAEVRGALPNKAEIQFDHGKGMGRPEPITVVRTKTGTDHGGSHENRSSHWRKIQRV